MYNKNTHTICDKKIGYHLHSLKIAYFSTVERPQLSSQIKLNTPIPSNSNWYHYHSEEEQDKIVKAF